MIVVTIETDHLDAALLAVDESDRYDDMDDDDNGGIDMQQQHTTTKRGGQGLYENNDIH